MAEVRSCYVHEKVLQPLRSVRQPNKKLNMTSESRAFTFSVRRRDEIILTRYDAGYTIAA